jgi:hypothetical protein
MKTRVIWLAGLVLVAACQSTNTPSFRTDAAPGFSVSGLQTYSWAFQGAPSGMGALQYQRIKDSFDSALAARGFRPVAEGGDFIIGFTVGARDRVETTNWGPVGPTFPGWGRGPRSTWAFTYSDIDVRTVTRGALAVDIFDGRTKLPVWHGIASRDLGRSGASPELIQNAVTGLVDRFAGVAKG